jgi:N-acetylglucosaminyl-diphospho-decaprenol L-rhamnosyltransferase
MKPQQNGGKGLDVTIVIVNWNGGQVLFNCLESIRKHAPEGVFTIVVDNDSGDGSREKAQAAFPEMRVLNSGGNIGFGRANNYARPHVATRYVLFLNPDTEILPGSLETMVQFLRSHEEVGMVGCQMVYGDGEVQEQGIQWRPNPWNEFLNQTLINRTTRRMFRKWVPELNPLRSSYAVKLYGGCMLLEKSLLDQIGWFDDRYFMYAEDVDLCFAVMDAGKRLYYLAEARIVHHCGKSSGKAGSSFAILMKCASIEKFMAKHYGGAGALFYRATMLWGSLVRLAGLGLLSLVELFRRSGKILEGAIFKQKMVLLWSLGLKRAEVPKSRKAVEPESVVGARHA